MSRRPVKAPKRIAEPPTLRELGADTKPVKPIDRDDEVLPIEWPSTAVAKELWSRWRNSFETPAHANQAERELGFDLRGVEMIARIRALLTCARNGLEGLDVPIEAPAPPNPLIRRGNR